MSLLGKYLKSLRTRRHLTALKASRRAQMEAHLYSQIEAAPESSPSSQLGKIFQALRITQDEYYEFFKIAQLFLQQPPDTPAPPPAATPFKDRKGINGRSRAKRTRKKLTRDADTE